MFVFTFFLAPVLFLALHELWPLNFKENVRTILCVNEYVYCGRLGSRGFHDIFEEICDQKWVKYY